MCVLFGKRGKIVILSALALLMLLSVCACNEKFRSENTRTLASNQGSDEKFEKGKLNEAGKAKRHELSTQLFQAIVENDINMCKQLLSQDLDPNAQNLYGDSLLTWSITRSNRPVFERLLELGANPNQPGFEGLTPLMWTARRGEVAMAKRLLEEGAKLELLDSAQRDALFWATEEQQLPLLQLFLEKGVNPNRVDSKGWSPLLLAVKHANQEACRLLVLAGADPFLELSPLGSPATMVLKKGNLKYFLQDQILKKFPKMQEKMEALVEEERIHVNGPLVLTQESFASKLHAAINQIRREHGLVLLELNPELTMVAESHSRDMAERHFFSHVNPDGEAPGDRWLRMGFSIPEAYFHPNVIGLGENIFKGPSYKEITRVSSGATMVETIIWYGLDAFVKTVVDGWMSSPGHRANILDPKWRLEGLGFAMEGDLVCVTQNFY